MGDRITADATTLMRQASMTAHEYLVEAVKHIDNEMGKGYSKEHPELVAAFMAAAASDFRTAILAQAVQDGTEALVEAITSHRE